MLDTALSALATGVSFLQFTPTGLDGDTLSAAVAVYIVYLLLTLVFGGFILLVAGDRLRQLETRVRRSPLRAAGMGIGGIVTGVIGFAFFGAIVGFFVSLGAPDALALLLLGPIFAFSLALLGVTAVGEIIGGSWLLRTVKNQSAPNLWLALVVGAVFVNMAYFVPVFNIIVGFAVIVLPVGGLLEGWLERR